MKRYELTPNDSHKSFYGKAIVEVDKDGNETLYSYNTAIVKRLVNGELIKLWSGWSATTGRHIRAFCGLNKKEFTELKTEEKPVYKMAANMTPQESYNAMIARRCMK